MPDYGMSASVGTWVATLPVGTFIDSKMVEAEFSDLDRAKALACLRRVSGWPNAPIRKQAQGVYVRVGEPAPEMPMEPAQTAVEPPAAPARREPTPRPVRVKETTGRASVTNYAWPIGITRNLKAVATLQGGDILVVDTHSGESFSVRVLK